MEYPPPPSTLWSGFSPSPEKSSRILIREHPHRAIAIVSSSHALILRHSPTTSEAIANGSLTSVASARNYPGGDNLASKCMVEFSSVSEHLLAGYRNLAPRPVFGTLGLISIDRDVFLCVITQASRVATVRPGETVEKIESVQFFCLNSSEYDEIVIRDDLDSASVYGQNVDRRDYPVEHPCQELQKLLSNGSFYYSTDFDVTNRMQDRPADSVAFDIDNFDESFLWNSYMISPLVQFRSRLQGPEREALDASRILTSAIRGFCKSWAIPQGSAPLSSAKTGLPSYLTVISRLSCRRAGTRFNARGIDDDGNVANFVETETCYWSPSGIVFSYAQVRGSVPVFWEQAAGLIPAQQKITVTRSTDGTQPAFDKHFSDLESAYGAVHVVNLLSTTKPNEAELTSLYRHGIRHCPLSRLSEKNSLDHALLRSTEYDFHAETKGPQGYEAAQDIRRYIEDSADGFAYYLAEETDDLVDGANGAKAKQRRYVVVLQQEGVFRTNCLDCLDRTNLIQTIISQMAVEAFLGHRGQSAQSDFWSRHASLWADNGDALSKIYAGTGALKSSYTRHGKMSFAGAIADVRKSAARFYINNFTDDRRQATIDTLLGRLVGQSPVILYDPISDFVLVELQRRSAEYSSTQKINIWVGTFNLNGRTDGIDEDLSPWLCPPILGNKQPEIIAVGFQEIVELSPQQIMNSDPTRKQLWERAVKKELDRQAERVGGEKYVLLRSGQLVGAALCIFVKASVLHNIKNVEGGVKKTGLSGIAGNKGAVAIRMDYANTPICFVTAHLAAGFANYDERNKDYATIHHGLRFQRNRRIDDHDSVIWFGDFNYRIGLGLEAAKEYMKRGNLESLYENDQLNLQMVAGLAFRFYSESRITFMPTYKFDIGTDDYDTSEKARIPAWTDRILRKGTNIRQMSYSSAPLRFSDHRPVYATFECVVSIVDEPLRDKISREIYERRKMDVGNGTANLDADDSDEDEDLIGYDAVEPGLPPASSDRQKWWLENGKQARSSINPPKPPNPSYQTILNPKRPSNPYTPTDEPDWVNIPRSESRLSNLSTSPFEHINHSMLLSSSASSTAPRKLPPSLENNSTLPAKIGRMGVNEDGPPPPPPPRRKTADQSNGMAGLTSQTQPIPIQSNARKPVSRPGPPPPPQRSVTSASQPPPSSVSQRPMSVRTKSPPPVAKKPAHLATSTTSSPNPNTFSPDDSNSPADEAPKPQLPKRPSSSVQEFASSYNKFNNQKPASSPPVQILPRNGSFAGPPAPPAQTRPSWGVGSNNSSNTSVITSGRILPPGAVGLHGLAAAGATPPPAVDYRGYGGSTEYQESRPSMPPRKPIGVPAHAQQVAFATAAAAAGHGQAQQQKVGRPRPPPPASMGSLTSTSTSTLTSAVSASTPVPIPAARTRPAVDLLADDTAMEMQGWKALEPSS